MPLGSLACGIVLKPVTKGGRRQAAGSSCASIGGVGRRLTSRPSFSSFYKSVFVPWAAKTPGNMPASPFWPHPSPMLPHPSFPHLPVLPSRSLTSLRPHPTRQGTPHRATATGTNNVYHTRVTPHPCASMLLWPRCCIATLPTRPLLCFCDHVSVPLCLCAPAAASLPYPPVHSFASVTTLLWPRFCDPAAASLPLPPFCSQQGEVPTPCILFAYHPPFHA